MTKVEVSMHLTKHHASAVYRFQENLWLRSTVQHWHWIWYIYRTRQAN